VTRHRTHHAHTPRKVSLTSGPSLNRVYLRSHNRISSVTEWTWGRWKKLGGHTAMRSTDGYEGREVRATSGPRRWRRGRGGRQSNRLRRRRSTACCLDRPPTYCKTFSDLRRRRSRQRRLLTGRRDALSTACTTTTSPTTTTTTTTTSLRSSSHANGRRR